MAQTAKEPLLSRDVYQEIGKDYRHFLNWRQALFGGFLISIYTVARAYAWLSEQGFTNFTIVYLAGLLLTFCFWFLEIQNRALYQACTKAGSELEKSHGLHKYGIYTKLEDPCLRNKLVSHSNVLSAFYLIVAFFMVYLLFS